MQTILLLGAYGFLGTNVMKYVDSHGLPYRFITFDRTERHPQGITFSCTTASYAADFGDTLALERVFEAHPIDIVLHSLSTTVPLAIGSVRYDVESNLLPTVSLMDTMCKYKVRRLVFFSSGGAVYGERNAATPHRETDPLYPKSSYGVVKAAIEKYIYLYQSLYGLRPLVLRLSNPYGPYHFSSRQGVINVALRAAQSGTPFTVWGDGTTTKDYIFAPDMCAILFALLERDCYGEIINVASGHLLSVNEILAQIKSVYPDFIWNYQPANAKDVDRVALCTDRLRSLLPPDFTFSPLSHYLSSLKDEIRK